MNHLGLYIDTGGAGSEWGEWGRGEWGRGEWGRGEWGGVSGAIEALYTSHIF